MASNDPSLSASLSSWASSELRITPAPSPATLSSLVAPPRAAALFGALVARARSPQHVCDARVAAALRPHASGVLARAAEHASPPSVTGASVASMQGEAAALEKEVLELRAEIARKVRRKGERKKRRREMGNGRAELTVLKAACEHLVSEEGVGMARVLEILGEMAGRVSLSTGIEEGGGEGVGHAVAVALQGVDRVSGEVDSCVAETAERNVQDVASAFDATAVLEYLRRTAGEEQSRVERRCGEEGGDMKRQSAAGVAEMGGKGEEDAVVEDDCVVLEEIRLRHMHAFIESEGAIADASQLEDEVAATLGRLLPSSTDDRIKFARLAGEHAALAELDRIDREYRMCRSAEAVARDAEVQRARSLRARADAASGTLATQAEALQGLVRECRRLISFSNASSVALCETMQRTVPSVCSELQNIAKTRLSHSINRVRTAKSVDASRDAELCIAGAWFPAANVSFLSEEVPVKGNDSVVVEDLDNADFAVADAEEMEQSAAHRDVLNQVLAGELERDLLTVRALGTRAGLIGDEFLRERSAQEQLLCPALEGATAKMKDCAERLVPAAESSIDTWWTQPVRSAAPWYTVKGRTLKEWELQVVERLTSRRNGGNRSGGSKGTSTSQSSSQGLGHTTSVSSGVRTPESRPGSSQMGSSFTEEYKGFDDS